MKYSALLMLLFSTYASNSHRVNVVFCLEGSLQPKLKLGRYPGTLGHCIISLLPPAGMEEQVSMVRMRLLPSLGIVTEKGSLRITWISLNDCMSLGVQFILSLPDRLDGVSWSRSLDTEANFALLRQISLKCTLPKKLQTPFTVVGLSQ